MALTYYSSERSGGQPGWRRIPNGKMLVHRVIGHTIGLPWSAVYLLALQTLFAPILILSLPETSGRTLEEMRQNRYLFFSFSFFCLRFSLRVSLGFFFCSLFPLSFSSLFAIAVSPRLTM